MFTGSSNGIIRVHNIPPSLSTSPSSLDSYWSLAVHDNHIGAITHLSITCDDHYVITAGADGNVFVFSTHLPSVASTNTATSTTLEVYTHVPQPLKSQWFSSISNQTNH